MHTLPMQLLEGPAVAGPAGLTAALRSCAPLPPSALFIGLAGDGLPVLLDLRGPSRSPVLVAADRGAGKTRLLKTIARSIEMSHDPHHVRYAAITTSPSEWNGFGASPHCEGILSFHHALTTGYMASLVRWTQSGDAGSRSRCLVVLIDDLETLSGDGDLRDSRNWLLAAGPAHGIQPIATLTAAGRSIPGSWLAPFSSRLFGCIKDARVGRDLAGAPDGIMDHLQPGSQFATREAQAWLPFWLPEID